MTNFSTNVVTIAASKQAKSNISVASRLKRWRETLAQMYPVNIMRLIVNYLGAVSVIGMIGTVVLGCLGKVVPDSVQILAATSIGALAGAVVGNSMYNNGAHPPPLSQQQKTPSEIEQTMTDRSNAGLEKAKTQT